VYYINGGQYEEIVAGGTVTQRSHVGGYLVRSTVSSTTTLTYVHKDHIGSTEAMTDGSGNMISANRMSFDPWGQRQNSDWTDGNPPSGNPDYYPTTRGFTGHEMLDQVNLIHMNGRVYDPVTGRFLTPDIFVQAPYNSQSFNRYSYVLNNPLSLVDPTGYCSAAIADGNFAAMLSAQYDYSSAFRYSDLVLPLIPQDAHLKEAKQSSTGTVTVEEITDSAETPPTTVQEAPPTPPAEDLKSNDASEGGTKVGGTAAGVATTETPPASDVVVGAPAGAAQPESTPSRADTLNNALDRAFNDGLNDCADTTINAMQYAGVTGSEELSHEYNADGLYAWAMRRGTVVTDDAALQTHVNNGDYVLAIKTSAQLNNDNGHAMSLRPGNFIQSGNYGKPVPLGMSRSSNGPNSAATFNNDKMSYAFPATYGQPTYIVLPRN
jgi:RHS repeat-associated protein